MPLIDDKPRDPFFCCPANIRTPQQASLQGPELVTMAYQVLTGGSCYTPAEEQKLLDRINQKSTAKANRISGQWLYYIHSTAADVLDTVGEQLLQATGPAPTRQGRDATSVKIYVTPRNISPWSSKATSIAQVCGLRGQVHRIERGRAIVVEFDEPYDASQGLPFRDVIYDRMTENLSPEPPAIEDMFAEGARRPLEVVDIFADEGAPLAILQDYNREMGLGLDQPSMEYLVAEFKNLGRSPNDIELFMWAQVNSEHVRPTQKPTPHATNLQEY